jgi:polyphenol oxidase
VLTGAFEPPRRAEPGGEGPEESLTGLPAVCWAFTDRHGGISKPPYASLNLGGHVGDDPAAVELNRRTLAQSIGVPRERLIFMHQIHGSAVATIDASSTAATTDATDAVVTATPGIALAVLVADCVPVLLADPCAGIVAAVHSGRPGVREHIAVKALDAMTALGARADRVQARLGPAICGRCYEVPAEMRDDVAAQVPAAWSVTAKGTPGLDLRAAIAAELSARGVAVELVGECAAESPDHYSYRRDGASSGRFAGVVWIQQP